ncbi:MAG: amino acid permease, partial [Prolixibacteraceae bacterium]|nr:amino acid permease [Prolixibacteraceae bacterium]
VYIDTLISPSYTSAIAQAIQMPGIAGMENNMVIFEYDKLSGKNLDNIIDNFAMVRSGNFDVCILASTGKHMEFRNGIHVWIKSSDQHNVNLMILLSFIILGHPDWKKSTIKIFEICQNSENDEVRQRLEKMVVSGRLPITTQNIEIIEQPENISYKKIINDRSANAALTMIGFREETLKNKKEALFAGYDSLGTTLFVNSQDIKEIS